MLEISKDGKVLVIDDLNVKASSGILLSDLVAEINELKQTIDNLKQTINDLRQTVLVLQKISHSPGSRDIYYK